ncbi:hypothetical protein [Streptomyces griseoloalbus]|uniref:Uncharacterized protein n=1 Tax=Streptomyces griseoloalbus TaxID=67303 RepID=A0A7W8BVN1_9ACTN|nr:hypothetical protein [Streptomyces albaduncus]MBB5128474.1 hypothetical protein [Streptomyces albaduncus]GGW68166.1 hypothetical protein GCM10010340_52860 [Streptomyces albaduncus]
MARIRTIKPEFFTSLTIADLTPEQRLTFIGLWTHCDDEGRCVDDARLIKAAVWPLDDRTAADVEADLRALTESSLITRYTLNRKPYMTVNGWREHQRINRPTPSKLPAPDQADSTPEPPLTSKDEDSPSAHAQLSEDSRPERNREQGKEQGTGNRDSSSGPAPAAPDPAPERDDVERLCTHLADRIAANGSKRPTITKAWRTAARLMLDKDGRTEEQVHGAIDWCQNSEFWRSNVLSMSKLRDKYDTLRLQAARPATGSNVVPIGAASGAARPSTTDQRVAAGMDLAARLRAEEAAQ